MSINAYESVTLGQLSTNCPSCVGLVPTKHQSSGNQDVHGPEDYWSIKGMDQHLMADALGAMIQTVLLKTCTLV